MVAGDVVGTVQEREATPNRPGQKRGATRSRSAREREQRIAELEAENRRLARELSRREQKRQAIIDRYERILTRRANQEQDPGSDRDGRDVLARVRRLFK